MTTEVFLYPSEPNQNDVRLRDPTVAASSGATITADLSTTEAQDVAAFSAALVHVATLAVTEAKDVAAFAAVRLSVGTLAATEAKDVASFSGALVHTASLAATEAQDTAAFAGSIIHVATLAATEAQDTALFTATVNAAVTEHRSGGYLDYGGNRRRTPEDISRERERFGITIEAAASVVIDEVAARQAQSLEQDAHKRFEELERELQAQEIEWRAEYLTALNAERERLITAEIAALLQTKKQRDIAIMLALIAASV